MERLEHLHRFISDNFSRVVFDTTARQMERHDVSSCFVSSRITELFRNLVKSEQSMYCGQMEAELKDWKSTKSDLNEKLQQKEKRIDRHIARALDENKNMRDKVTKMHFLEDQNRFREKSAEEKAKCRLSQLNHQTSDLIATTKKFSPFIEVMHKDISDVAEATSQFVKEFKTRIKDLSCNYEKQVKEFRKAKIDTPNIMQCEDQLNSEKNKTKLMQESLNRILSFVSGFDTNTKTQSVSVNNYTNALFKVKVKQVIRKQTETARKEMFEKLSAPNCHTEAVLAYISKQIDKGNEQIKRKYDSKLRKHQKRVLKLQNQIAQARQYINRLETENPDKDDFIRQLDRAKLKMQMDGSQTDLRMEKVYSSPVFNH